MSGDGTDFQIYQHKSFWRDWFLFKFKGPGVHYEVAVSIRDGDIVWCHGLFPCGQLSDIESLAMALLKC